MNSLSYINECDAFPSPTTALDDPNGLLAVGGDLSPNRLLSAYYHGIFPWFNDNDPILWWSPDPRAIFTPDDFKCSKSLKKFLKKQSWQYRINSDFAQVIKGCAGPRANENGTWISSDIEQAYCQLHKLGKAHSIEVWEDNQLIGGLYGICVGKIFCGESMFHHKTNASKAAFAVLNQLLFKHGVCMIDAQIMNPHLASLGAKSMPRIEFLDILHQQRDHHLPTDFWVSREVTLEL